MVTLTGLSKRTLWRRIAAKRLRTLARGGGLTKVALDDVLQLLNAHIDANDRQLILGADAGEPQAQCELALVLMSQELYADALPWLNYASERYYPEAMYWLGRCLIAGRGQTADVHTGLAWIEKASQQGHIVARHLLTSYDQQQDHPQELDQTFDTLERALILDALNPQPSRG